MAEPIIMGEKPFNLGKATGEAISDTFNQRMQQNMQMSAQLKMADMMHRLGVAQQQQQQQREAQAIEQLLPGKGAALAGIPKDMRDTYLKDYLTRPGRSDLANALGGRPSGSQVFGQQESTGMPVSQQDGMPVGQQTGRQRMDLSKIDLSQYPVQQQIAIANLVNEQNKQDREYEQKERFHEEDRDLKLRGLEQKADIAGNRMASKTYAGLRPKLEEINTKALGSHENINRLLDMKKLNDSDQLNSQSYASVLHAIGLGDYPALLTPDSQDFNTQAISAVSHLKEIFPRATNADLLAYVTTQLPTLMQSKKGREILINRGLAQSVGNLRNAAIWNDTLDKYGDNVPLNVESKINKKILKSQAKLYQSFSKGIPVDISEFEGLGEPMQQFTPTGELVATQTQQGQQPPAMPQNQPTTPQSGGPTQFQPMEQNVSPYTGIEQKERTPEEINQSLNNYMQNLNNPLSQDVKATGARIAEAGAGLPGAAQWLGQNALALGTHGLSKIAGTPRTDYYSEWAEKHPYLTIPTASKLREWDKIEAGTKGGEFVSDLAGDLVGAYTGSKVLGGSATNAMKGTLIGKALGLGAKTAGFGPTVQAGVDIAGSLLGSMEPVRSKMIEGFKAAYPAAEQKLATISTGTKGFTDLVDNILDRTHGLKTKDVETTVKKLKEIEKIGNRVPATFWTKQDQMLGKLSQEVPRSQRHYFRELEQFVEKKLDEVSKMSELGKSGVEDYRTARELYKAVASGINVSDYAKKMIKEPIQRTLENPVSMIFGLGKVLAHPKNAAIGLASVAATSAGVPVYNAIRAMAVSPKARRLYGEAVKNATAGQSEKFVKNVTDLNKLFKTKP